MFLFNRISVSARNITKFPNAFSTYVSVASPLRRYVNGFSFNTYATSSPFSPKIIVISDRRFPLLEKSHDLLQIPQKYKVTQTEHNNPTDKVKPSELLHSLLQSGRYNEALSFIENLLKTEPSNINFKLTYAIILLNLGDFDKAIQHLLKIKNEAIPYFSQLKNELIIEIKLNLTDQGKISKEIRIQLETIIKNQVPPEFNHILDKHIKELTIVREPSDQFKSFVKEVACEMIKDDVLLKVAHHLPEQVKQTLQVFNNVLDILYLAKVNEFKSSAPLVAGESQNLRLK